MTRAAALTLTVILSIGAAVVVARASRLDDRGGPPSTASASPGPANTGTPKEAAIDSVRLLGHLAALADDSMGGRAPGTPGSESARSLIIGALRETGVAPVMDDYEHPFSWGTDRRGVNVIGRIPGRAGRGTIILTAHYDHLGIRDGTTFNGTDDNASGTAAVLEIARIVAASPLNGTLVVILLDAEEAGLQGARAFVTDPPVSLDDALNVNLDMISRSEGLLWAAGASHTPALRPLLESVAVRAPLTLRLGHDSAGAPEGDDWTGASDHGPFHDAGVPFVYFGVEDHPDYHQPTDDFGRVDAGDYVNSVRTILMAIRALDGALPLPPTGPAE